MQHVSAEMSSSIHTKFEEFRIDGLHEDDGEINGISSLISFEIFELWFTFKLSGELDVVVVLLLLLLLWVEE